MKGDSTLERDREDEESGLFYLQKKVIIIRVMIIIWIAMEQSQL